jgi:spoIIIJ-associated protein
MTSDFPPGGEAVSGEEFIDSRSADDGGDGQGDDGSAAHSGEVLATEDSAPVGDSSRADTGQQPASSQAGLLEREGDIAADYLEVLLDIADMDGDIDIDVEADRAAVSIVGDGLDRLIGPGGITLEALQELTRLAVYRETGVRSRLMLDVGGHRARRRAELTTIGREAAERVSSSGAEQRLAPMTPFERKVVHDAVAAVDGVMSESEGDEPERCIVIRPA